MGNFCRVAPKRLDQEPWSSKINQTPYDYASISKVAAVVSN